jgi:hypothetical protein
VFFDSPEDLLLWHPRVVPTSQLLVATFFRRPFRQVDLDYRRGSRKFEAQKTATVFLNQCSQCTHAAGYLTEAAASGAPPGIPFLSQRVMQIQRRVSRCFFGRFSLHFSPLDRFRVQAPVVTVTPKATYCRTGHAASAADFIGAQAAVTQIQNFPRRRLGDHS